LPIPKKAQVEGVFKGQLVLSLKQHWTLDGAQEKFNSGDLVSFDL
jgi:prolyl oligopeptidase